VDSIKKTTYMEIRAQWNSNQMYGKKSPVDSNQMSTYIERRAQWTVIKCQHIWKEEPVEQ
jgi:hypothetical protein